MSTYIHLHLFIRVIRSRRNFVFIWSLRRIIVYKHILFQAVEETFLKLSDVVNRYFSSGSNDEISEFIRFFEQVLFCQIFCKSDSDRHITPFFVLKKNILIKIREGENFDNPANARTRVGRECFAPSLSFIFFSFSFKTLLYFSLLCGINRVETTLLFLPIFKLSTYSDVSEVFLLTFSNKYDNRVLIWLV